MSQIVAQGEEVDALALLAYPLHPPSNPSQLRDAHLPDVPAPTLFCSGTRDAFGAPDELRAAASMVPRSTLHLIEGADHGFGIRKSSGRSGQDVWAEAVEVFDDWLQSCDPPAGLALQPPSRTVGAD